MNHIRILLGLLFCVSCATPISPTGGQPDKSPLEIGKTEPVSGTTRFKGKKVRFTFNDFPDRASLQQAVKVIPEGIRFIVVPGRKYADVVFTEGLPEETTIQVVLGTSASDAKRNKLEKPHIIAFSTGDVIDKGAIVGGIVPVDPTKIPSGGLVALYRSADSLSGKPRYFTQTDSSGGFRFDFVKEASYKVLWFNDVNRNYKWDKGEVSFRYSGAELISVDTSKQDPFLIYTRRSEPAKKPALLAVGVLTKNRLRLRFDKPVSFQYPAVLPIVVDSSKVDSVVALFSSLAQPDVVIAQSKNELLPSRSYRFPDSLDGFLNKSESFTGNTQNDTALYVPASVVNGNFMLETEPLRIHYTKFDSPFSPIDSLVVLANGEIIPDVIRTSRFNEITAIPVKGWNPDYSYEVKIFVPATNTYLSHTPKISFTKDFGELEITIDSAGGKRFYALYSENGFVKRSGELQKGQTISLPEGNYFVQIFEDENGDGMWNPAVVDPFKRGEPVFVAKSIEIKKLFTTELKADLDR